MRVYLLESFKGREFNHLEDLAFIGGKAGALKAIEVLERLAQDSSDVSIKWDGNPTVYWGRDPDGTFVLVGKNGWGKNKSTTPEDLYNFITNSGRGEEWREDFGNSMAEVFRIMERNTPDDFRGYVYGDLLYHPGNHYQKTDGKFTFTPNNTTYMVKADSELGQRIAKTKIAIAAHSEYDEFGDKNGTPVREVSKFNTSEVLVLGLTYVTHRPEVDTSGLDEVRSMVNKYGNKIDELLEPRQGLSDMKQIIYTYVNQMSRAGKLDQLSSGFEEWLANSKVSDNKKKKIANLDEYEYFSVLFDIVLRLQQVKNSIIDQYDQADADVTATTKGQPGGEGYVAGKDKIKLVPRHRWTPN